MRGRVWRGVATAGLAGLLMGAAPIPATPRVKVGTVCEVHVKVRITARMRIELPKGPKTLPAPLRVDVTRRLEVLGLAGGAINRLRVIYASVDAQGPGTEEASLAGRTFIVSLGKTAAGPPVVTEHGKVLEGKLAHKVWDDVTDVMAPTAVTAFVKKVLAQPGKALRCRRRFADLAGETEDAPQLVSATTPLEKVTGGRATTHLVSHDRVSDGELTMDLHSTATTERDAATGRVLHIEADSTVHGAGTMSLPVGPVKAQMDGTATMTEVLDWDLKAAAGAR